MAGFPDVQGMLHELLSDYATVAVRTGPDLNDRLPFVAVRRIGGGDNTVTDTAVVDVDVFTDTYSGLALAERIRQRLLTAPLSTSFGVLDRATTDTGPREIPWTDQSTVRRFAATYRLRTRRTE